MKKGQKKRNISEDETRWVINALLDRSTLEGSERVLAQGAVSEVASLAPVGERQIRRIWKKACDNANETGIYRATPQKKGNCGRKQVYHDAAIAAAVKEVPLTKRGTQRSLAKELGVSAWTVNKKKKEGIILSHSNSIRPHLRDDNKFLRFLYAANRVRIAPAADPPLYLFDGAYDEVHVVEKWFEISQVNKRYYLVPDEPKPNRKAMPP